jgi:hypothetical protein
MMILIQKRGNGDFNQLTTREASCNSVYKIKLFSVSNLHFISFICETPFGHTKTTVFQIIAWPWASLSTLAVPNKLSNPSSPLFISVVAARSPSHTTWRQGHLCLENTVKNQPELQPKPILSPRRHQKCLLLNFPHQDP